MCNDIVHKINTKRPNSYIKPTFYKLQTISVLLQYVDMKRFYLYVLFFSSVPHKQLLLPTKCNAHMCNRPSRNVFSLAAESGKSA